MNTKSLLTSLAILLTIFPEINAQTIDRGPYLQMVTTTSIYIHWRTDSSTDSKVWYGDDPSNLTSTLFVSGNRTDHEIHVTGLTGNTTYYYAVGDSDGQMVGGDSDHYFKTSPSSNQPVKIWVLGDAGKKNDNQRAVRDAYYGFIGDEHIDIMLLLGDNAYSNGTDDDYQLAWFENMYEDRLINSVMWSTFGNHDGDSANSNTQTGPYYDIFNFPKNGQAGGVSSGTEAYYSFDYGNIHIISLNSWDIDGTSNSPMIQWLQDDVDANTKEWMIAMFHHPAYSGSTTHMELYALPILEAAGVDLVLWGHYHWYERSFLINGHYGNPASYDPTTMTIDSGDGRLDGDGAYTKNNNGEGTIYMNTGSAGSAGSGSSAHPIMAHNAQILGSVDIEVNDQQMNLKFIDSNDNIEDYFTISKEAPLPIELLTFNAQTIDREIKLEWITASEINNDFFTLERSLDGRVFHEIATIPGKGTSSEINNYNYFDQNPITGLNYYRLKQTDYDGTFSYSEVEYAEIKNKKTIWVYPSQVTNIVTIEKSRNIEEALSLNLHDMGGKILYSNTISDGEFKTEISLSDLTPGVYFISIFNNEFFENFKIVKL